MVLGVSGMRLGGKQRRKETQRETVELGKEMERSWRGEAGLEEGKEGRGAGQVWCGAPALLRRFSSEKQPGAGGGDVPVDWAERERGPGWAGP